jgi:hypothetical protein
MGHSPGNLGLRHDFKAIKEADPLRRQLAPYEADLVQRRFLKRGPDNRLATGAREAGLNALLRYARRGTGDVRESKIHRREHRD